MRQLLKLEIDTCRVKGQIWTQQDLSIVNATIQHTSDLQTQLQFNNLTRWFTHLISWFKHQISATGQNALQTAEYQLLLQRYCIMTFFQSSEGPDFISRIFAAAVLGSLGEFAMILACVTLVLIIECLLCL